MVSVMYDAVSTPPSVSTGSVSRPPTAKMAVCGGLMMAVNSLIPNMPRLDMLHSGNSKNGH